ncbi:hypothetical protein IKW75_02795 [Candidatus Saccharibacteria bacterium]|nr:hypothetical protein [Candidatus Saccharibacteria bacterium]
MNNDIKILEEELDDIKQGDEYILTWLNDLKGQKAKVEAALVELANLRESAWASIQEAEANLETATEARLVQFCPKYTNALRDYNYFCEKYEVRAKQLADSIKLEEQLSSECLCQAHGNVDGEDVQIEDSGRWRRFQQAHENRKKLYEDELARLNEYAKERAAELEHIRLDSEFELSFTNQDTDDCIEKRKLLNAVKEYLKGIEISLNIVTETHKKICTAYRTACDEHSELFSRITNLKSFIDEQKS